MSQVQETSLLAFREIQPRLGRKQATVYRVIQDATVRGFDVTNTELARILKWPINRITGRVKELRDGFGLVVQSCTRVCGVTGYRAMAWKAREVKP